MRSHLRHLGPVALIIVLLIGVVPAATAAEIDTSTAAMRAAEIHALDLTNAQRTRRGLVKLRLDARLSELARDRAQYMAQSGQFSHTQSNGTDVFDMIDSANITWYAAGEIIAWNTAGPLDYSAEFAVDGWMGSPSHKAIVLSSLYNYVGFGLAIAPDGTRYWAGVYLKGPDRRRVRQDRQLHQDLSEQCLGPRDRLLLGWRHPFAGPHGRPPLFPDPVARRRGKLDQRRHHDRHADDQVVAARLDL